MRKMFDEQMENLNLSLIKMGGLCEDIINKSMEALTSTEENPENEKELKELDGKINEMNTDIEKLSMKILLQQQPVASDLREIYAALRMIYDMQRISSQAIHIMELAKKTSKEELYSLHSIIKMTEEAIKMVHDSIEAFVKKDNNLVDEVIQDDEVLDNLFKKIKKELANIVLKNQQESISSINLLIIAKYLERIGDHAVNIAYSVKYYLTGSTEK